VQFYHNSVVVVVVVIIIIIIIIIILVLVTSLQNVVVGFLSNASYDGQRRSSNKIIIRRTDLSVFVVSMMESVITRYRQDY
jgi:hypothetical protein